MALRQWMVTHEWMVKPTPQTEWIERRGVLVWIAEVFTSLGAGLYLVSLIYSNWWGMLVAWFIIMFLKVPLHLIYFGKPFRFWRILFKPQTSWLSRGFIFMGLFVIFGAVQLGISYWLPGAAAEIVFKVLAGIMAFGVAIYSGFVVGFVGAIKLWNSAIIPILFVIAGLAGGLAVLLLASIGEAAQSTDVAVVMRVVLVGYAVFVAIYLWVTTYESAVARDSVMRIIQGSIAPIFWIGVVLLGIVIPIIILFVTSASAALGIAAVFAILGGVTLRYVILKAGVYSPLVPAE